MSPGQVSRVQRALNAFYRKFKIPHARLTIDGRPGPATKAAIRDAKYLLGYGEKYVRWATGTDDVFLKRLAHPTYHMTPIAVARGIARRLKARSTTTTRTVQGCAKIILASPNVTFWSGLSTGSERKKFVQLAETGRAYCDHTSSNHRVKLNLMQFLVDCSKSPVMINALTGGSHTAGSHHYADPCSAVDIDLSRGSTAHRESLAVRHGGRRNFETNHEHYDL